MIDSGLQQIDAKIQRLKTTMERTKKIWDQPTQTPGSFVTGRSNRSPVLSKRLEQENERKANAYREYQEAARQLETMKQRRVAYVAGEVYADGQPRADAPSRQRQAVARQSIADWLRDMLRPGDCVALAANPHNTVTIKRVNKRTLTDDIGVKWSYDEVIPLAEDGEVMKPAEMVQAYLAWERAREEA